MADLSESTNVSAPPVVASKRRILPLISIASLALSVLILAGAIWIGPIFARRGESGWALDQTVALATTRAEASRSVEELNFLALLAAEASKNTPTADHARATARLNFTVASALYDLEQMESSRSAALAGGVGYGSEGSLEVGDVAALWLDWRSKSDAAKSLTEPLAIRDAWVALADMSKLLAAADPDNLVFLRASWLSNQRLAEVERTAGSNSASLDAALLAVNSAQKINSDRLGNATYQRNLWTSVIFAGDAALRLDDLVKARSFYSQALELADAAHAQNSTDRTAADLLASLNKLASLDLREEQFPSAKELFARVQSTARMALEKEVTTGMQRNLAQAHARLADIASAQGEPIVARDGYLNAITLGREIAAKDPANVSYLRDLARNFTSLGDVHLGTGDTAAAAASYQDALRYREQVLAIQPGEIEHHRELVAAHTKYAQTVNTRSAWNKAISVAQILVDQVGSTDGDKRTMERLRQKSEAAGN